MSIYIVLLLFCSQNYQPKRVSKLFEVFFSFFFSFFFWVFIVMHKVHSNPQAWLNYIFDCISAIKFDQLFSSAKVTSSASFWKCEFVVAIASDISRSSDPLSHSWTFIIHWPFTEIPRCPLFRLRGGWDSWNILWFYFYHSAVIFFVFVRIWIQKLWMPVPFLK